MWWLSWALAGLQLGGETPDAVASDAPPAHVVLSDMRQQELHCVMLAGLTMDEYRRGVSKKNYGLTAKKAQWLSGHLTGLIMAETGLDAGQVRALYHQEFENFAAQSVGYSNPAAGQAALKKAMAKCQPVYESLMLSGSP
jgi:hypothetical protein